MLRRASNVYAQIVSEEEEKVRRFCKFIGSIVAFCLVLLFFVFLLLMVALVVYAGVYYFLVPTKEYTFPLYFDYGDGGAAASGPDAATAALSLTSERTQWVSTNLAVAEKNKMQTLLMPGQAYTVVIDLVVPESPVNVEHGPLMVETELFGEKLSSSHLLAKSRRPVFLKYKSTFVRYLQNVFFSLPLGLGLVREEQKVSVFAFDRFVESRKNHLVNAKVTLKTRKLEVYNARLKIVAELSGVRYFMYHWFFPSAVVGISNILFMEIFGLTTAVIVYLLAFGPPHFLLGGNVGGSRDSSANPSPYESPRGSVHDPNPPFVGGAQESTPRPFNRRATLVLPTAEEQRQRENERAVRQIELEEKIEGVETELAAALENPVTKP
jgi:hypothetical protein